jgi:hypothetical protein
VSVDGWKEVTMGYIFTKNMGPHFNLLLDAESLDYFSLFFNDELLNNIAIEEQVHERQNYRSSVKPEVNLE